MAFHAVERRGVNNAHECRTFGSGGTCYRSWHKLKAEKLLIKDWLLHMAKTKRASGLGLCSLRLRNVRGFGWNHKFVYRTYCELEFNSRIRPRKRLQRKNPGPLAV